MYIIVDVIVLIAHPEGGKLENLEKNRKLTKLMFKD